MSADLPEMPDDGDDLMAAEYVLRLLSPDIERAMDRRVLDDPVFAARVRDWEARLASMTDELGDITPSRQTKRALMEAIGGRPESPARRWWLGTGLGLATVAALLVISPLPSLLRGPEFEAQIASADGTLRLNATVTGAELVLARLEGGPRPGRALELWLIAEGAPAPVSLGVLPEADSTRIALTPALTVQLTGAALAVSDEPPGGSPTGTPTGEVLAAAPLVAL
ncbi:anti-sigma factor domain-containing protein [Antarctobacter sp.]|uniref:anti-sigma factor n=1 Tax=Antarctobacter sp. TaxID=1872577 RepID=UPI002B27B134|nr:anti-sigma factor [Antarctobacter sp.]